MLICLKIIGVNKNPVEGYNISLKCDLLSLNVTTDQKKKGPQ